MKYTKIPTNFKYPKIDKTHYRFHDRKFGAAVLNKEGDWRPYLPPEEDQNKYGIESSACYIESQQHAIATLKEEKFDIKDENYSARFNALLSKGTESGGDPLAGAESIRKDGLIPDEMMPFSEIITSWMDFHSWKGVDEDFCRETGREFLENWQLNYDIVFEDHEPVEVKYRKLRQALLLSPVPISVMGWYENEQGEQVKPEGIQDNHLVLCVYLDEKNRPYFWDTYAPYLKVGEPFYNSEFAMRWGIEKKDPRSTMDIGSAILNFFKGFNCKKK